MKKPFLLFSALLVCLALRAQIQRAFLLEDFTIAVEKTPEIESPLIFRSDTLGQMSGFPKGALANKSLKNLRNVTLADLDKDGAHDILWGADNKLFAHSYEKLLWSRTLSGIVLYPPSVANLDKDGGLEIVQATGGSQTNSRIYLLDADGRDLSGWPLNFNGHWIITAPALSDVDDDGDLEIIFNERDSPRSRLHIVRRDGAPFNSDWPVPISGTLAVTPSIGDVDQDGEKEIYVASTTTRYLLKLNGEIEAGWPQETDPSQRYSFQSPLLIDINEDGNLEIIGATHGDLPEYYILQADGSNFPGWPKPVPGNVWTFNTPTAVIIDNELRLFMSRPISDRTSDMLYGWNSEGRSLPGFPLFKPGGLEGLISIADVDGDEEFELLFGSNLLSPDGSSFIHAYELDGATEVPGFPIRPRGWTFMNGVNVGDVNGDGLMDLVALSYTQNIENSNLADSIYLNVYELQTPYSPERVLWSTYKGNNTRDGLLKAANITPVKEAGIKSDFPVSLYPNPVKDVLRLQFRHTKPSNIQLQLYDAQGRNLETIYAGRLSGGAQEWTQSVNHLPPGMYFISVRLDQKIGQVLKFIVL